MKLVVLTTARLKLRPFESGDAERFIAIQQDWQVTRMLRMADFPPDRTRMRAFVEGAAGEWRDGSAFRFAVVHGGRGVGCADVAAINQGWGEIGYWLERSAWGFGLASEAGAAVRDFAFETLALAGLNSGHAADNPASGRVLTKLGFIPAGETKVWSKARGTMITQKLYRLERGP